MAQTKEKLISDIVLRVTQGNPTDDLALDDEQVAHWIEIYLHDLIRREIVDAKRKGESIPPIYIRRDVALELQEETVTDVADVLQRLWIDLPEEVLDLPRDGGIIRVLDYDGNLIHMTTVEDIEDLRKSRFSKPSPDNVIGYREGKKLFIEGFNSADIEFNPIMASYIPKQDVLAMDDDDEILITDQLIPLLIDLCVQTAKLQMYGTQVDPNNDGVDNKQVVYHTAIQNPTKQDNQPEE